MDLQIRRNQKQIIVKAKLKGLSMGTSADLHPLEKGAININ